jgi:hypothetical protein
MRYTILILPHVRVLEDDLPIPARLRVSFRPPLELGETTSSLLRWPGQCTEYWVQMRACLWELVLRRHGCNLEIHNLHHMRRKTTWQVNRRNCLYRGSLRVLSCHCIVRLASTNKRGIYDIHLVLPYEHSLLTVRLNRRD